MIKILVQMTRQLVAIILIATVLEMVLPAGRLKPLVRMAIGFFVIITILNPVLGLIFDRSRVSTLSYDLPLALNDEVSQAITKGQKANSDLAQRLSQDLSRQLEGQIRGMSLLFPGIKEAVPRVTLDKKGGIERIQVVVTPENYREQSREEKVPAFSDGLIRKENPEIKRRLTELISSYYGVSPEKIDITWR